MVGGGGGGGGVLCFFIRKGRYRAHLPTGPKEGSEEKNYSYNISWRLVTNAGVFSF